MKDPVDHILRPQLPWRNEPGQTECGLNGAKVPTMTREQFFARLKDMGQRRAVMLTCMTCAETARRWSTWEDDPRQAVDRAIQWETGWRRRDSGERGTPLRDELLAIADLIAAHREEFDASVAAIQQRRAWLQLKKDKETKPKKLRAMDVL